MSHDGELVIFTVAAAILHLRAITLLQQFHGAYIQGDGSHITLFRSTGVFNAIRNERKTIVSDLCKEKTGSCMFIIT